jgi:hypothetical protein
MTTKKSEGTTKRGATRSSRKRTLLLGASGSVDAKRRGRVGTLKFGSVEAKAPAPHPDIKSANIALGQQALKRAKSAFLKTGVSLRHGKSVPTFFADSHEPSVLIRRVDGREERGRFVGGTFVPAE